MANKFLIYGAAVLCTAFILMFLFSGGDFNHGDREWGKFPFFKEESKFPPKEFKEKCELAKAFRLYKDHKGRWACKLEDGRVWTEDD